MRTTGTVVYYENYSGTGLVRDKDNGEFYFLSRNEIFPSNLILYEGLEISFSPRVDNEEFLASKIILLKGYKTGHVLSIQNEEDRGYIADRKGRNYWFKPSEVILMGSKRIQQNDRVQFLAREGGQHPVQKAIHVACDKRSALARFSKTRNWAEHLADLAALAKDETWNYQNLETEPLPLLANYFMHTFHHIFEQKRISFFTNKSSGMAYACFHTGLVSKNNEDIYAVFLKDLKKCSGHPYIMRNWVFSRFTDSWMNLLLQCDRTPLPADYSDIRGYDSFDASLEIRSHISVILKYQKHLLPKFFLLQDDNTCAAMIQRSIDHSLELLRSGKITPVPKYFYGSIEFIVPLYFDGQPADVALIIKRAEDSFYLAHNLTTLDIAYKNARLLGPVNSDWLKPVFGFGEIPVEMEENLVEE